MERTEFLRVILTAASAALFGGRAWPAVRAQAQDEGMGRAAKWRLACAHDGNGAVESGSLATASRAIGRGADLLGYTAPSHH